MNTCTMSTASDTYDTPEAKAFFEQNYSYIYYIFYDVFTNVESDLKQRGAKAMNHQLHTLQTCHTYLESDIHHCIK